MKLYAFQAIHIRTNAHNKGIIQAVSKTDCEEQLAAQGFFPLEIRRYKVHDKPIQSEFFLYWAKLLSFGLPADVIFETLSAYFKSTLVKKIVFDMHKGVPLIAALSRFPKTFPSLVCTLVEIGILTQNLHGTLEHLYQLLSRDEHYHKAFGSALIYPLIVMIFLLIALGIFSSQFDQNLLNTKYFFFLTVVVIPFCIPKKYWPFFKKKQKVQFLLQFYLLLSYNIDVLKAFRIASPYCGIDKGIYHAIEQGKPLHQCLTPLLHDLPFLSQIIEVFHYSAHECYKGCILEQDMLFKTQERYTKLIEPALLLLCGLIVVIIMFSTLVPVYEHFLDLAN